MNLEPILVQSQIENRAKLDWNQESSGFWWRTLAAGTIITMKSFPRAPRKPLASHKIIFFSSLLGTL